jgi:hypothetical protein
MGGSWTSEQWLVASIIVFVVMAVLVVLFRLYGIYRTVTGKRARPNLRGSLRSRKE